MNQEASDTHQWLDPTSAHCPSVFQALIRGETFRYLRGKTIESEIMNQVNFFTDKPVERSYNSDEVYEITSKIKYENRNRYLMASKPAKGENKQNKTKKKKHPAGLHHYIICHTLEKKNWELK